MGNKFTDLHPHLQKLATEHIKKCKEAGIDITIFSTYRTFEEQDKLYAQGRTTPGKIVTNAKGGSSYHNYGLAYDCAPVINGQCAWDRLDLFKKVGVIGKQVGLTWGGDFPRLRDYPHFQYTFGLAIADLKAGKRPPEK